MVITTKAQRTALWDLFRRTEAGRALPQRISPFTLVNDKGERQSIPSTDYRAFRRQAFPLFGGGGCIMIPFAGMTVGIETDGYTHS